VARAGLVGVDPTVRAVRPTAAVLGLVNLCSRNETPVSTCVRDLARESGTLGFSSAPQAAEWRRECLAVSRMFLKDVRRSDARAFADFPVFSGSRPYLTITSAHRGIASESCCKRCAGIHPPPELNHHAVHPIPRAAPGL
jgi:hypothetical protein